jgi:acetate kinase
MNNRILILNSGSSSIKFAVFDTTAKANALLQGAIAGLGNVPVFSASDSAGLALPGQLPPIAATHESALTWLFNWLHDHQNGQLVGAGHRVVHGGEHFAEPALIDAKVFAELERLMPLAPLHQPHNLAAIRALTVLQPELPQVACFDTAFHRAHDALADHYAIPQHLYEEGVRRYGFHGLSYEYIASRLPQIAPDIAHGRVIVAHLGSGASMCALKGGRSVESSLGFTALDGLPMGTRPGQLDPGVVLYLVGEKCMDPDAVQHLLYHDCGLKGLSGISNDVRDLEQSADPRAAFALDYFVYRAGLYAGMLAAALAGLDAFVFTAGIGENSANIRARIAEKLAWLGAELDPRANTAGTTRISSSGSRVALYVVSTDEELMIARHTLAVISAHGLREPAHQGVA